MQVNVQSFVARHAQDTPEKPAVMVAETGESLTYAGLDQQSNALAHVLRAAGIRRGDAVALLANNSIDFFIAMCAFHRSGVYWTPLNTRLKADEVEYIVRDSGASALLASAEFAEAALEVAQRCDQLRLRLLFGTSSGGFEDAHELMRAARRDPIADECDGSVVSYSSGTTGRPKGILRPLPDPSVRMPHPFLGTVSALFGVERATTYLVPAPLHHAAGHRYSMIMLELGATVVVMQHFNELGFLEAIEKYRVTCTQVVPTMLIRLLRLPADVRDAHDLGSLRALIHGAAPCPIEVKQRTLDWLGPIVHEYYGASEAQGYVYISPQDALRKPGSVGRVVVGAVHIVDPDSGSECEPYVTGLVYFESDMPFEYLNDEGQTRRSRLANGWLTVGDMGYLDEEGFLYLTDRRSHMIISGGVNIYPQEIENLLAVHHAVLDVAVIGVPNAEFGEEVKAVVQLADPAAAGSEMEAELIGACRSRLAHYKCPRSVDFVEALPRGENGKLYKNELKRRYWTTGSLI